MIKKHPPFGRGLAERQRYRNLPLLVVVCVGLDAWERAKSWRRSPNDIAALVCPLDLNPGGADWPVADCLVVVQRDDGPDDNAIVELVRALLRAGAKLVAIIWADWREPSVTYFSDGTSRRIGGLD